MSDKLQIVREIENKVNAIGTLLVNLQDTEINVTQAATVEYVTGNFKDFATKDVHELRRAFEE